MQPITVTEDLTLYWMHPGNETTLQAFCTGENLEGTTIQIRSDAGTIVDMAAEDTLCFPVFQVPESDRGTLFQIRMMNVAGPISLSLKSWAPYLALQPERVLAKRVEP